MWTGKIAEKLRLKGDEVYSIEGLNDKITPRSTVTLRATKADGKEITFKAEVMLNTAVEVNYYRNGGILHTVLRNLVK